MIPDYVLCDRCQAKVPGNVIPFIIPIDRRMDGAGSMETITESVDLCGECCRAYVRGWLRKADYDTAKVFVDWARRARL